MEKINFDWSWLEMNVEGFNIIFDQFLAMGYDYRQAYKQAEKWHESICGKKKYSDYDSFRVVRNRIRREKLKQREQCYRQKPGKSRTIEYTKKFEKDDY